MSTFTSGKTITVKLITVGDTGVGKTSMLIRYLQGVFPDPDKLKSTIGVAFFSKDFYIDDNVKIVAQIWDFAGQERFREFMKKMFRGTRGGILVFDLSNRMTLDDLESFWIPQIQEIAGVKFSPESEIPFILVGNKKDLIDTNDTLALSNAPTREEIKRVIDKYGFEYFETSAKNGTNIGEVFER
ncbi:MAG: GTP-binding protein, partial [Candidatus Odinarchaeota archaeon]|nr:GTP-binding protein [Candidatus Odinarchaeota archaeon]